MRKLLSVVVATAFVVGCSTTKKAGGDGRYKQSADIVQHKFSYKSDVATLPSDYENALWIESSAQRSAREAMANGRWVITETKTITIMEPRIIRDEVVSVPVLKQVSVKEYRDIVHFDFDSSKLKKEALSVLEKLPLTAADNFVIDAHTDGIGTSSYNDSLSLRRANAVSAWLAEKGIKKEMIAIKGHGKTDPIATNDTSDGRAKNRRATVILNLKDEGISEANK